MGAVSEGNTAPRFSGEIPAVNHALGLLGVDATATLPYIPQDQLLRSEELADWQEPAPGHSEPGIAKRRGA
jgi:hypothetical protein